MTSPLHFESISSDTLGAYGSNSAGRSSITSLTALAISGSDCRVSRSVQSRLVTLIEGNLSGLVRRAMVRHVRASTWTSSRMSQSQIWYTSSNGSASSMIMNPGRAALLRCPKEKWKETSHLEIKPLCEARSQPARYSTRVCAGRIISNKQWGVPVGEGHPVESLISQLPASNAQTADTLTVLQRGMADTIRTRL